MQKAATSANPTTRELLTTKPPVKMNKTAPEIEQLPGFRFHPTEEELLNYYLRKIATGKKLSFDIIGFLNIYHHEPWDLPGLAKIGEREWYFFVERDRRQGHGGRPNRITEKGFWKATGSDRQIRCPSDPKNLLGLRKTLVFYTGRAPCGNKTDWIMNEYRLPDKCPFPKEDVVLCKIYRKATSLKVLEQRAAMGERSRSSILHTAGLSSPILSQDSLSSNSNGDPGERFPRPMSSSEFVLKVEDEQENKVVASTIGFGSVKGKLTELQVPKFSMDLTMDYPLLTQLRSPVHGSWSPYAHVLMNF
ncbi:hypothetical protein NMG60_11007769 [Bertholletia excelsa]